MGGPAKRQDSQKLQSFVVDAVAREFIACARARREDPNEFNWRARRTVEALLSAIVLRLKPNSKLNVPTIADLLKIIETEEDPGRDARSDLTSLQSYCNVAVHFQTEEIAHDSNADSVSTALVHLVHWFYEREKLPIPEEVREHLDRLHERRYAPTFAEQLEDASRREKALLNDIAAAQREVGHWRNLASGAQLSAHAPPPSSGIGDPQRNAPGRARLFAPLLGVAVGVIAGIGLDRAACSTASRSPGSPPGVGASVVSGVAAHPPEGDAGALAVRPPAPTTETDSVVGCPVGTVDIPARAVALSPLPAAARNWGRPRNPGQIREFQVPRFCMQTHLVSVRDVRASDPVLFGRIGGHLPRSTPESSPMGWLTRAEAAAYCSRWNPEGTLPSFVQWESLTRAVEAGLVSQVEPWQRREVDMVQEMEWIADDFPAEPLDLGPPRRVFQMARAPISPTPLSGEYPRQSWNRRSPTERVIFLHFRCVAPPVRP